MFDEIPPPEALQQIAVMEQLPPATSLHQIIVTGQLPPISSTSKPPSIPAVTSGLDNFTAMSFSLVPPVPTKLIEKIESGKFVDMSELLSDYLGVLENEDQQKSSKPKHRNVTNILEWARCFALYTSILSRKQPQRVADLLGYQSLIILASIAYEGDSWQGYDRIFRQHAAVKSSCTWASIDAPLWNVAFAGKTMSPHCKHCFSFGHTSTECAWASDHSTHVIPSSQSTDRGQRTTFSPSTSQRR